MASAKQIAAAKRNIKKAQAARKTTKPKSKPKKKRSARTSDSYTLL